MTGARRAPSGPLPRMARLAPRVRCRIRRRARQAMAAITAEAPAERSRARRRSPHVSDQQKNKNDLQRRASARNARSAVVLIHKAARVRIAARFRHGRRHVATANAAELRADRRRERVVRNDPLRRWPAACEALRRAAVGIASVVFARRKARSRAPNKPLNIDQTGCAPKRIGTA
ncbi:hypothetical protein A8D61_18435 [Burkholderia cenocepacia]|nr:hypothetical protein A8D61_18435 [Burkholderia cenocepacia]AQQ49833.1 hypothetical protein A8F32_29315 [Burkholderia cenocepacia]ONI94716.1 hypothetical protein A8F53_30930 [Burkholderia cenocepacia]ONJ07218.1 hypothetical protein A8F33_11805 [Burkholderia cenocepacia]ONJ20059.1 hypothetical protein A8D82_14370 [Burkholderia cenocepacia]